MPELTAVSASPLQREKVNNMYASQAQAGYFHTNPDKVGGEKVVKEFDKATKGHHLPKRAPKKKSMGSRMLDHGRASSSSNSGY